MLDSAAREVGTSLGYVKRLLKALNFQYVRLVMIVAQKSEPRCGKNVSEVKYSTVESIREWVGRCEEVFSKFSL